MIKPLYARERRALGQISATLCTGPLLLGVLLIPKSIQAEAEGFHAPSRIATPRVPDRLAYPTLDVRRDPFLSEIAAGSPAAAGAAVVRAVVLGASPHALVDEGGAARVVQIGSTLAGATVADINATGVVLDDGRRLPIAADQP